MFLNLYVEMAEISAQQMLINGILSMIFMKNFSSKSKKSAEEYF